MTDRRRVLQAGLVCTALLALPACSSDTAEPPESPPVPDPEQADELALITAYDQALTTAGVRSEATLRVIRDEHVAHLRALGWEQPLANTTTSAQRVGRKALQNAEREAARSRARAATNAEDSERAQILALIAASEAQHVVSLERP